MTKTTDAKKEVEELNDIKNMIALLEKLVTLDTRKGFFGNFYRLRQEAQAILDKIKA